MVSDFDTKVPLGVQPQVTKIAAEVTAAYPKIPYTLGYNPRPDHNTRRCVDYITSTRALGDQVSQYHLDSKVRLLVYLMIWNKRIIRSYDKPGIKAWTWAPYTGESDHTDHVHVQYNEGVYVAPQGGLPEVTTKVKKGDMAIIVANGALNGRSGPRTNAPVEQTRKYGDMFLVGAVSGNWAQEAGNLGSWFSMDYLFPQVKPNPKNAAKIKKGDRVRVTASGGLRARELPGGPLSTDPAGKSITRATNYQFTVTGDPKSGWITGGTNWYSSDYLIKVAK